MSLVPMPPSVLLRGVTVPLQSEVGETFVNDCARNIEGLVSDDEIKSKWGLSEESWSSLSQNSPLLEAVRAARERRFMTDLATSEAARRQYAKAPGILGSILSNEDISPRHRIEAARELRSAAAVGQRDKLAQQEMITITINLGADKQLLYEKPSSPLDALRDETSG